MWLKPVWMMGSYKNLKIIFFGLGSIGQRHAGILQEKYPFELFAFRSKKIKKQNQLGLKEVFNWKDVDTIQPDVAFITNPTSLHIPTAIECAKRGMSLFVEKPLGMDIKGLDTLSKLVKQKRITSYVAYCLRFHPVIQAIKKFVAGKKVYHARILTSSFLGKWRTGVKPHEMYSAHRRWGGGVLLDLSHELDYSEFILGDILKMRGRFGRQSQVTVDAEDYADILVETKNGPVNIHLDFLSQIQQRFIQIDLKGTSIEGDLINGTVKIFSSNEEPQVHQLAAGYHHCYEKQLEYFFANLENPTMMNNILEAKDLFKKIYLFKKDKIYG